MLYAPVLYKANPRAAAAERLSSEVTPKSISHADAAYQNTTLQGDEEAWFDSYSVLLKTSCRVSRPSRLLISGNHRLSLNNWLYFSNGDVKPGGIDTKSVTQPSDQRWKKSVYLGKDDLCLLSSKNIL